MKVLLTKMYRNKSLSIKVLLVLVAGCFLPRPACAQVTDIRAFVNCVNSIASLQTTVADAVTACVPDSGCFYTNTMSEESPQNACTLRDGTRLPRVIFSCTGPGGSQTLRFRPSFSLCTLGNDTTSSVINHIELGEDVNSRHVQKMGDIKMTGQFPLAEFGPKGVFDTPTRNLRCSHCHDRMGTAGAPPVNLFAAVSPELKDGTIDSNDPTVQKPASPVPLGVICSDIFNSTQLARNPSKKELAFKLCDALLLKEVGIGGGNPGTLGVR